MAKKDKKNAKTNDKNKKVYTNPANKPVGKIIVALLAISFVVAMIATVIYFIIQSVMSV